MPTSLSAGWIGERVLGVREQKITQAEADGNDRRMGKLTGIAARKVGAPPIDQRAARAPASDPRLQFLPSTRNLVQSEVLGMLRSANGISLNHGGF